MAISFVNYAKIARVMPKIDHFLYVVPILTDKVLHEQGYICF